MKSKKSLIIVLGILLLAAVIGLLFWGSRVLPTVNHALRISALLQPVLDAENQTMHMSVSAEVHATPVALESDIFAVTEDGIRYLAAEQNGTAIYLTGNLLLLENGKAFKISENLQGQTAFDDLLPQIRALYYALAITPEETDDRTSYSITVTGAQIDALLTAASLGETFPAESIQELTLCLTEKAGALEQITFSGSGTLDGAPAQLHITLSDFRILAPGDYPIPGAVKQSAATVDPDALFSLTEDLYRLMVAMAPFADMESIDGTLELMADCGPLQLHTQMKLSDLKTASGSQLDPEKLQALPVFLGWLCMEGDISCAQNGSAYVYTLELDQQAMQDLSRMILPELAQYGGSLNEGSVTIILKGTRIVSMDVSIAGSISIWIVQIPLAISAVFTFSQT